MKILIADEKKSGNSMKKILEASNSTHQAKLSYNCRDAIIKAISGEFNLLIIGSYFPKEEVLYLLEKIRVQNNQLLILALANNSDDVTSFLNFGADSWLLDPFEIKLLLAKVKVLQRQHNQLRGADVIYADLRIDPITHKVWRSGREVDLTIKEYAVLSYLIKNAGNAVSRKDIAENCWGGQIEPFTNIIDVYINYLRKKIDGPYPTSAKLIHTQRNQGYMLEKK